MALSYAEEMKITSAFLAEMKHRLSDKTTDILPEDGKYYDTSEPHRSSLIGCIGALPDPNYSGPQAPNSVGMVLLVSPDSEGKIECNVSGRFDVCHRYIPNLADMKRDLIIKDDDARDRQIISAAFKRYTVQFSNLNLKFDTTKSLNTWVNCGSTIFNSAQELWRKDNRIFRRCHLSPNGGARFNFDWGTEPPATQADLDALVYRQLFENENELLQYVVSIRGRVRQAPHQFNTHAGTTVFLLELFLENQTSDLASRPFGMEFPYLLDARFSADIYRGNCFKVPFRLKPEDYRLRDQDGLPGYGINCAVHQLGSANFETNPVPTFKQQRVDAPTADAVGMPSPPHYKLLATDPLPILDGFVEAMKQYSAQWAGRIDGLIDLSEERDIAISDSHAFAAEIELIQDGIELLRSDNALLQCFMWMNEAMAAAILLQGKKFQGWHLFQLGFILTQVRSIYERHAAEKDVQGSWEYADVLWFATGGGKTEAYLGIISLGMLYSRMKGREYGVTAWMRFPLRMLSVQQFQRLSYVLAQSNIIREREQLGGWPFTIGYYTGNGTPNSISSSFDEANFLPLMSFEKLQELRFISDCPYCGTIDSVQVKRDYATARVSHCCNNAECWSNVSAETGKHNQGIRGEIGIYVSDEECYRYLPSVLVGTVDKLAVIGHNQRFANFFGAAKYYCPEHGFSQKSVCEHKRIVKEHETYKANDCGNNTRTSKYKVALLPQMNDPGISLAIQDELHLLRESLGNFDAHYESLMSTLQKNHGGRPPKILAATATIKDFGSHINHLYLKKPRRFPSPGIVQGESFYARKAFDVNTGEPLVRRWFAGILPIGRGNVAMQAVAEVSASFLDQVDTWCARLRDQDETFMASLDIDHGKANDVLVYIEKNLNADLIYANSKKNILEVQRFMDEKSAARDNERSSILLDGNTRLDKILGAIHHVENKLPNDTCRTLVATSVVSHGVDIAELNFMVMAGWPKSTAEYIQASARSGRVHPGLVFCVLSSRQLFESGVFMNFKDMHRFLDKLVDSVPINRFAPNVLDRTLPGILSAVILNWGRQQPWGADLNRNVKPLVAALQSTAGVSVSNAIKAIALECLSIPSFLSNTFDPRVISSFNRTLNDGVDRAVYELARWPGAKNEQLLSDSLREIFTHAPLRSFRDIENQILIKPSNASSDAILTALGR